MSTLEGFLWIVGTLAVAVGISVIVDYWHGRRHHWKYWGNTYRQCRICHQSQVWNRLYARWEDTP